MCPLDENWGAPFDCRPPETWASRWLPRIVLWLVMVVLVLGAIGGFIVSTAGAMHRDWHDRPPQHDGEWDPDVDRDAMEESLERHLQVWHSVEKGLLLFGLLTLAIVLALVFIFLLIFAFVHIFILRDDKRRK